MYLNYKNKFKIIFTLNLNEINNAEEIVLVRVSKVKGT